MPGGENLRRIGGIDHDRGNAMRIERGSQRRADQPAAEDENVCAIHGPAVAPPFPSVIPAQDAAERAGNA